MCRSGKVVLILALFTISVTCHKDNDTTPQLFGRKRGGCVTRAENVFFEIVEKSPPFAGVVDHEFANSPISEKNVKVRLFTFWKK